ncbi:MAG: cupin domain-containing protein [Actinomycetota bacterium]|nr:cupin domain-containing protein [Actinomycetota bacterium]
MAELNINRPEWDADRAEPPFAGRVMRLGHRAGAAELGASLYEMDPGGAVSPYHAHHGNEELLLVLSGRPLLRTPDGSRRLEAGDTVSFHRGLEGAHRVSNPGEEPARVLVFSTMKFPEIAEHLDTGTLLTMTGPAEGKTFPAETDVPFIESAMRAMQAATEHEASEGP